MAAGSVRGPSGGLRAVVLSGEGPDFCAGLDFGAFQAMRAGERLSATADFALRRACQGDRAARGLLWAELPVPVIAALRGNTLGGGLQIALGADIRIVAPDARLSVFEVAWGLVPNMTGTQLLPELVGRDVAKELTYTARIVSGEEAASDRAGDAHRPRSARRGPRDGEGDRRAQRARDPGGQSRATRPSRPDRPWPQASPEPAEISALIGSANQAEAVTARLANATLFSAKPPIRRLGAAGSAPPSFGLILPEFSPNGGGLLRHHRPGPGGRDGHSAAVSWPSRSRAAGWRPS